MARRRRRSLGYQPTILRRTPTLVYVVLALLCVGGLFYSKQNLVKTISGRVVDAYSGAPLPGVDVVLTNDKGLARTAGLPLTLKISTDNAGLFEFNQASDKYSLSAQFNNYRPFNLQQSGVFSSELKLVPTLLRGNIKDDAGQPLGHAAVTLSSKIGPAKTVESGIDGGFSFSNAPDNGNISARSPGYRANSINFDKTVQVELSLQSFKVKAAYVAPDTLAGPGNLVSVLNTLAPTSLTAIVVDLKDESGKVLYNSKVAQAAGALAGNDKRIPDLAALLKTLKDRKLYTIARIVCFQDPVLTDLKPEWTLKNRTTGKAWTDSGGYNWINPYNQEAWKYYLDLATEAAQAGFDEIDFDGLHFPVLGSLRDIDYGRASDAASRTEAITAFLNQARQRFTPLGVYSSVTVFGSALIEGGDLGIGMDIVAMAPQVDYISPLIYPVEWEPGAFGIDQPASKPYDLVKQSMLSARSRLADRLQQVRPWLQDFSRNTVTFGEAQVRDEIRAVEEFQTKNSAGWILYNPASHYTIAAIPGKS